MDYFYFQKSNNAKVWLKGTTARTRLEFAFEVGYYTFIGNDGEMYNVMDIQACNLLNLFSWSSLIMGLLCCVLARTTLGYAFSLLAFLLAYMATKRILLPLNKNVENFNNSHFKILSL